MTAVIHGVRILTRIISDILRAEDDSSHRATLTGIPQLATVVLEGRERRARGDDTPIQNGRDAGPSLPTRCFESSYLVPFPLFSGRLGPNERQISATAIVTLIFDDPPDLSVDISSAIFPCLADRDRWLCFRNRQDRLLPPGQKIGSWLRSSHPPATRFPSRPIYRRSRGSRTSHFE